MPIIQTVDPQNAKGNVKEAYAVFEQMGADVPLPMQMHSASPELMGVHHGIMKYFMTHKNLGFPVLTHIRLLTANEENYPYCTNLNAQWLQMAGGLTPEQIEAAKQDPENAALDDKDKALLKFVVQVVKDPASTTAEDIQNLRDLGWTDADVFDAVYHAMGMVGAGIMFKAFKMAE
ncbi:MAG: hypothetical protein D3926_23400 [Desulfobacteraceae bacterium]|nr:MAG: hypothetical protein D3926_23400 [Desulfobacteraceae bacterium]